MTIKSQLDKGGTYLVHIEGLSSETKPTSGIANGSTFTETDTGAVYTYNSGWSVTTEGSIKSIPIVDTDDNGKVLKVSAGAWSIGTDDTGEAELPTFDTTEDVDKVLTVTADGLAWVTPA